MDKILFNSEDHKAFYNDMMKRVGKDTVYHRAFFYCMGVCDETRRNIENLYDFKSNGIRPDNIHQPFQTGSSYQVTRMAYNLWNGYVEEGAEIETTPSELFRSSYGNEFFQAVKLRYPEVYRAQSPESKSIIDKLANGIKMTSGQVVQKSNGDKQRKGDER
jgi:hypothetical protein